MFISLQKRCQFDYNVTWNNAGSTAISLYPFLVCHSGTIIEMISVEFRKRLEGIMRSNLNTLAGIPSEEWASRIEQSRKLADGEIEKLDKLLESEKVKPLFEYNSSFLYNPSKKYELLSDFESLSLSPRTESDGFKCFAYSNIVTLSDKSSLLETNEVLKDMFQYVDKLASCSSIEVGDIDLSSVVYIYLNILLLPTETKSPLGKKRNDLLPMLWERLSLPDSEPESKVKWPKFKNIYAAYIEPLNTPNIERNRVIERKNQETKKFNDQLRNRLVKDGLPKAEVEEKYQQQCKHGIEDLRPLISGLGKLPSVENSVSVIVRLGKALVTDLGRNTTEYEQSALAWFGIEILYMYLDACGCDTLSSKFIDLKRRVIHHSIDSKEIRFLVQTWLMGIETRSKELLEKSDVAIPRYIAPSHYMNSDVTYELWRILKPLDDWICKSISVGKISSAKEIDITQIVTKYLYHFFYSDLFRDLDDDKAVTTDNIDGDIIDLAKSLKLDSKWLADVRMLDNVEVRRKRLFNIGKAFRDYGGKESEVILRLLGIYVLVDYLKLVPGMSSDSGYLTDFVSDALDWEWKKLGKSAGGKNGLKNTVNRLALVLTLDSNDLRSGDYLATNEGIARIGYSLPSKEAVSQSDRISLLDQRVGGSLNAYVDYLHKIHDGNSDKYIAAQRAILVNKYLEQEAKQFITNASNTSTKKGYLYFLLLMLEVCRVLPRNNSEKIGFTVNEIFALFQALLGFGEQPRSEKLYWGNPLEFHLSADPGIATILSSLGDTLLFSSMKSGDHDNNTPEIQQLRSFFLKGLTIEKSANGKPLVFTGLVDSCTQLINHVEWVKELGSTMPIQLKGINLDHQKKTLRVVRSRIKELQSLPIEGDLLQRVETSLKHVKMLTK